MPSARPAQQRGEVDVEATLDVVEHAPQAVLVDGQALLDTLAAAYAEAGDFPSAIGAAEEALNRARSSGDSDAIKLSEKILASLRENLPYREEPQ